MFNVASLFAGGGGGEIGLKGGFTFLKEYYSKNPIKLIYANEVDRRLANIFEDNFNIEVDVRDIKKVKNDEIPQHDILVGGFPCVTFSIVAQNPKRLGFNSGDGVLYKEMSRILKNKQPKAFIAENVKGILSANNREAFPLILKEFSNQGYRVYHSLLKAVEFGIPQKRERVFIVGVRKDISGDFVFPRPTLKSSEEYKTIEDILIGEKEIDRKYYFSEKAIEGLHRARRDMNKGRAQNINDPCNTVGAHLAKVSLNSTDPVLKINGKYRRFTPREVARIQSFPETYRLGEIDPHSYRALGNAIPPVLMWYVSKSLINFLKKNL